MEGASTHFHIVGLQHHTALLSPKALQGENQILEGTHGGGCLGHNRYPQLKMGRKLGSIPKYGRFRSGHSSLQRTLLIASR